MQQIDRIVEAVEETLKGTNLVNLHLKTHLFQPELEDFKGISHQHVKGHLLFCHNQNYLSLILGHTVRILGQKKENGRKIGGAKLDLPKIRKNPLIEIIAISAG